MSDVLNIARRAATAGARVVESRTSQQGARRSKSTATDFVTDADIASGVAVVEEIRASLVDARFVVEEDEVYALAAAPRGELGDDEVWVIDPLDGTTSFIHGFPCYSVSVACLHSGRPVAGAVFDVARHEMHSAAEGLGAFRDGVRVHCSDVRTVGDALLVTGFPYDRGEPLDTQLAVLAAFLRAPVHGIRRDGSAAIDYCHVACSRADGFWEYALKPWDMAAGALLVTEAGGALTDFSGKEFSIYNPEMVSSNGRVHQEMVGILGKRRG